MVLEGGSSEGDAFSRSVARIAHGKDSYVCIFKPISRKNRARAYYKVDKKAVVSSLQYEKMNLRRL